MPGPVPSEARDALQKKAFETVYRSRRLLLEWGTGVGKSRVGYRLVEQLHSEGRTKILLLVAETPHKQNWKNEFLEVNPEGGEALFDSLTVECYASLQKYKDTRWDAIVADEAHHLRSELRQDILTSLKADWFLALSATISDKGDGESLLSTLNMTFGLFANLKYGLEDAIDDGLLPEPIIDVRKVTLNEGAQKKYDSLNEYVDKCKQEYYSLRDRCGLTFGQGEVAETQDAKDKWMHAGSLRKQFLGTLKTWEAKRLLTELFRQHKRVICFCATIKQIEKLGGENIINSKKSKKQNEQTIAAFNEHKIDSLFVVGMLQEGQNLKDIDAGLIVQLDGKERSFIQRFGRVMRSKNPYLYILYIEGTRDEEYLQNVLCDRDPQYIRGWEKPVEQETQQDNIPVQTPVQPMVPQVRVLTIKDISYTALSGPWLNQRELEARYRVKHYIPEGGLFRVSEKNRYQGSMKIAEGQFYGISVNPLQEQVILFLKGNDSLIQVETDWRYMLPTLMQIGNTESLYHEGFKLTSRLEQGDWTSITLEVGGKIPYWIGNQIPQYSTEDYNPRLNFTNNIIENIHARFLQQKQLKTKALQYGN